jgi:predicted alpha/beta-hydrolase family hydrolase
MKIETFSIPISETIGSVSAEVVTPAGMKAIMTLAHGAGAGKDHRFMKSLSTALAEAGIGTLRFNFSYVEKGKRMPDPPAIAEKTVGKVIEKTQELFPAVPLLAGGKSFGGRMTSQYISKQNPAVVKGIIFYGFPLHPPGKPSVERAAHLSLITRPMLFLQGTRDSLATVELVKQVTEKLSTATLQLLEGADHSFKVGKKELISELSEKTSVWFDTIKS